MIECKSRFNKKLFRRFKVNIFIAIVLPVHNGASTLSMSIESILLQTYKNFELIIIDDGSTDNSRDIIQNFNDERIRLFHQSNMGLARTLNKGIAMTTAELIARQDQDDISLPTRLEKQIMKFAMNPNLVLLGTNGIFIDGSGANRGKTRFPTKNRDLQPLTNFYNPFIHSSVMIRSVALKQIEGYSTHPQRQPPEDFELWNRLKCLGEIENLSEKLVKYRLSNQNMSHRFKEQIEENYKTIVVDNLVHHYGFRLYDAELLFQIQFLKNNSLGIKNKLMLCRKFIVQFSKYVWKYKSIGIIYNMYILKMLTKIILK